MYKNTSYFGVNFTYIGDPLVCWQKMKDLKTFAESQGFTFDPGEVTTITEESNEEPIINGDTGAPLGGDNVTHNH